MSAAAWPADPPLPREIQVEVTGACNLRCRMCLVRYRPPLNRATASMSFETFRRIVDSLPDLHTVTLQGLGEPLMAPDLFRMIEYAASRGIRMGFNTNATLLTRATAEQLVDARLGWLCISLDGARPATYESIRDGARFARVEDNVRGLVAIMRRRGATLPDLSVVFVAMRRNVDELPAMVRLAAEWGIPRLRVQNLSHSFDDTDPAGAYRDIRDFAAAEALWQGPDARAEAAFAEARMLADQLGVSLRLPALHATSAGDSPSAGDADRRGLGSAASGVSSAGPQAPPVGGADAARVPGCEWPWRSAYVRHDGKAQPCCMVMGADRAILGDVDERGFDGVWHGAAYRAFREGLLAGAPPDVCRGCSMYRGVF